MSTIFFSLVLVLGFSPVEAHKLTCIAKYESAFKPNAINTNTSGSQDHGILQINDLWFKGECKSLDPYLPTQAIKCARIIIDRQGWTAWVAYNKHKTTCDQYDAYKDQ